MFLSVGLAPHDVRSVCREVTSSIGNDRWLTCGVEGEINMGDAAVRGEKVHYGRHRAGHYSPLDVVRVIFGSVFAFKEQQSWLK